MQNSMSHKEKPGIRRTWPLVSPFKNAVQLDEAHIITRVNGEVRQDDTLNRMVFSVRDIVAYLSTFMTLQAGDVIVIGTPTGADARFDPPRYQSPGDETEVEVSGSGPLKN